MLDTIASTTEKHPCQAQALAALPNMHRINSRLNNGARTHGQWVVHLAGSQRGRPAAREQPSGTPAKPCARPCFAHLAQAHWQRAAPQPPMPLLPRLVRTPRHARPVDSPQPAERPLPCLRLMYPSNPLAWQNQANSTDTSVTVTTPGCAHGVVMVYSIMSVECSSSWLLSISGCPHLHLLEV